MFANTEPSFSLAFARGCAIVMFDRYIAQGLFFSLVFCFCSVFVFFVLFLSYLYFLFLVCVLASGFPFGSFECFFEIKS